jgi:hypothetical protein
MISTNTRDVLNQDSLPEFEKAGLGTELYNMGAGQAVAYTYEPSGAFSAAAQAAMTAPFALRIVDVIVEAFAAMESGTVKVMKATTEICTAIACAADGTVTHMSVGATAATKAQRLLAAGDVINIQAAGGTDATAIRGRVTIIGVRV